MSDGHLNTTLNLTDDLNLNNRKINNIEISPDGSQFVTVQWNGAKIWSIDGHLVAPLSGSTDVSLYCFRISQDGSTCAAGCDYGIVKIWNMHDGALIKTLKIDSNDRICDISPDLSKVCTGIYGDYVKIWNLPKGNLLHSLRGHSAGIFSCKINSDGSQIVSGSWDGTAKVWNMNNGELITTLAGDFGTASHWHNNNGELITRFPWHDPVYIYAITPDGHIVLRSNQHNVYKLRAHEIVKIGDMRTSQQVATLCDEIINTEDITRSVAVGPHGLQAVTGHNDGTFKIWTIIHPDLPDALSTLTPKQIQFLERLYLRAIHNEKADSSHDSSTLGDSDQYAALPKLIKDHLVKEPEYVPQLVEQIIIEHALKNPPYPPLTVWLWRLPPEALSTLSLKQVRLLEWIHELAIHRKKADFSKDNPAIAGYKEQYELLPKLIQDLVKHYIKFE